MRTLIYVYIVCLLVAVSGCKKDIPEPETIVKPVSFQTLSYDIPVFKTSSNGKELFFVKHKVDGNNVLVECIVQGISFRETAGNTKGKIIVYIDGKKNEEISSAAFIIKGLSSGTHHIKLEVITESDSSIIMKKEFNVTIR